MSWLLLFNSILCPVMDQFSYCDVIKKRIGKNESCYTWLTWLLCTTYIAEFSYKVTKSLVESGLKLIKSLSEEVISKHSIFCHFCFCIARWIFLEFRTYSRMLQFYTCKIIKIFVKWRVRISFRWQKREKISFIKAKHNNYIWLVW